MGVCGCGRGRGRDCEMEREFDWEWRGLGVSSMSSESSWGIVGIVRKSKEFRLGMSSGPWSESRPDFGVVTCGVYCGWLSFRRERREMSESRVDREARALD